MVAMIEKHLCMCKDLTTYVIYMLILSNKHFGEYFIRSVLLLLTTVHSELLATASFKTINKENG